MKPTQTQLDNIARYIWGFGLGILCAALLIGAFG